MSDVVLAAVFSSLGAALVAVAGAVASIFGPAWTASRGAEGLRQRETEDRRFASALEFTEALTRYGSGLAKERQVLDARAKFVATLRRGESQAARFTVRLLGWVKDDVSRGEWEDGAETARLGSDELFAWLRGDVPLEQLNVSFRELLDRSK